MEDFSFLLSTAILSVIIGGAVVFYSNKTKYYNSAANSKKSTFLPNGSAVHAQNGVHTVEKKPEPQHHYPGGKVALFFGSQTGTAEGFCNDLAKEGKEAGFDTAVIDLEEFDLESLDQYTFCAFLLATYGEGEPTDNAATFFRWLKDKSGELTPETLTGKKFTVFGLGNRQYEHYNFMGRFVDKRLEELGGERVYKYGEGDDDGTLEEDFEAWKEELWPSMKTHFLSSSEQSSVDHEASGLKPESLDIEVEYLTEEQAKKMSSEISSEKMNRTTKHFFTADTLSVLANRELRQDATDGSTKHIELDISGTRVSYEIADNLAVLPDNDHEEVARIAMSQGYNLDQYITLKKVNETADVKFPFPFPCTVRTVLTRYCDILTPPRRAMLKSFAVFASDKKEQDRLLFLAGKEGKEEFVSWIEKERRTIAEVLEAFPSLKIPLDHLMYNLPNLSPRYYTISSSPSVHSGAIHVTVSVVKDNKGDGRIHRGVCSNYLDELVPGKSKVPVFVRTSTFRLPKDPLKPIIMVGPGTGIAPMRAFLQEKARQKKEADKVGPVVLFFGCRKRSQDFIYKEELEHYQNQGFLTLYTAFSREQEKKIYVQDRLREKGEEMWKLVHDGGAYIYVCGGTGMGQDVMAAFVEIAKREGKMSDQEASAYVKNLQEQHRYIQELWS